MAVISTAIGGLIGGFGEKVRIPQMPRIDAGQVQRETTADNQRALPGLQSLGQGVNRFNTQQLLEGLEATLPGFLSQARRVVGGQLRGEIPEDVSRAVQQSAAESGLDLGISGGGIGRNLTARDLGLTSLGIQQQGLGNFEALAGLTRAPQFDVTSMFFSPQQRLDFAVNERNVQFNRDLLHAQVKAAPDPFAAAMTQALINDEEQIMSLIGNVAGMAGAACWVARAVYGTQDSRWLVFRAWMLDESPSWFRKLYLMHGPKAAQLLEAIPALKRPVKWLMDRIVTRRQHGATH